MTISGYVPFYNNASTVVAAVESLKRQTKPLDELFAVDDGSTDHGAELLEAAGFRVIRMGANFGRGAVRARAMQEASGDLVLCCDATNVLPEDFARKARNHFCEQKVAAVYGRLVQDIASNAANRWRGRHLFQENAHPQHIANSALLVTYGALLSREKTFLVGGYSPDLRHSEDAELGKRLLAAGWDVLRDPTMEVISQVQNSLPEVLERYWRWHAGKDEQVSLRGYWKNIVYSIKVMAMQDLRAADPTVALISLACPHYQFWRSLLRRPKVCKTVLISAGH